MSHQCCIISGFRHRVAPAVIIALVFQTLVACDEAAPVKLLFDRATDDPTLSVFPTDRYKGEVLVDNFSETQLAVLPYLRQLRFTAQTGFAPTTGIRLPFTQARGEPDRWVDIATVADAVRIYRVDKNPAQRVSIGDVTWTGGTGSLLVRPEAPFVPGRYGVAVLTGRMKARNGSLIEPSSDALLVRATGDDATDPAFSLVAAADNNVTRRADTLVFFVFTVTDATAQTSYLQAVVSGQAPASLGGVDESIALTPFMPIEGRKLAIVGQPVADGDAAIDAVFQANGLGALPRAAIGRITGGLVVTPNFISDPIGDLPALFTNHTIAGRTPPAPFSPGNPPALSATAPYRPIPFVAFFPKQALPNKPIIVALHPLNSKKEAFFAFAHAATAAGHALIAIDLYQHGARMADITPAEGDFSARVDVVLQATGVNFPDPFFNLTFLARTRDRFRQSLVDVLALVHILGQANGADPRIDINADGQPDDFGPVRIVGHSLGAMVGAAAAALSTNVDRVVLAAPGAHIIEILDESPEVGGRLNLLLLATGNADGIGLMAGSTRRLVPESAEREMFSRVAETIMGPVDPVSWAGALAARQKTPMPLRVLLQVPAADRVFTPGAQQRFADALGAAAVAAQVQYGHIGDDTLGLDWPEIENPAVGLPTFSAATFEGGHGFLLDFVDPALTGQAQTQAAGFLAAP